MQDCWRRPNAREGKHEIPAPPGGIHFAGVSEKARPVILAVDDATDLLALMAKALGADYEVLTASDAGTAIEKAFGEPHPDLILLDVEMPDISGFEVCR